MGAKKPRIVIIGAGMAGLAAANKLYTSSGDELKVLVVEGVTRIGDRINTSEFSHDRIELGATWIHGVGGSPVYEIATRIGALCSGQPWECMDGPLETSRTVVEEGSELGREVVKIEWHPPTEVSVNGHADSCPVTQHFLDGAVISADHVVVTVSLGVLKARTGPDSSLFSPSLPSFKINAILRLWFGTVNKLFLQLPPAVDDRAEFPFLQMAFHRPDSEFRNEAVPWWLRRTASLCPIHRNSNVLLLWFTGKEALHPETLAKEEIINGVSSAVNSMSFSNHGSCNGKASPGELESLKFQKVLRSKWGSNPLFQARTATSR